MVKLFVIGVGALALAGCTTSQVTMACEKYPQVKLSLEKALEQLDTLCGSEAEPEVVEPSVEAVPE